MADETPIGAWAIIWQIKPDIGLITSSPCSTIVRTERSKKWQIAWRISVSGPVRSNSCVKIGVIFWTIRQAGRWLVTWIWPSSSGAARSSVDWRFDSRFISRIWFNIKIFSWCQIPCNKAVFAWLVIWVFCSEQLWILFIYLFTVFSSSLRHVFSSTALNIGFKIHSMVP